jgi:DnaJ-class molecular chaperone
MTRITSRDQYELPWGKTNRVECERCHGIGWIYAGQTFKGVRYTVANGRQVTCPECLGDCSIEEPTRD